MKDEGGGMNKRRKLFFFILIPHPFALIAYESYQR
jgi:hypothetical protein